MLELSEEEAELRKNPCAPIERKPAGGRGFAEGCRRGAPFAAAARALARRAASWDIGGRGGWGALGLGAVDLAARSVRRAARLMMMFYRSVMAGVERCGH